MNNHLDWKTQGADTIRADGRWRIFGSKSAITVHEKVDGRWTPMASGFASYTEAMDYCADADARSRMD